MNPERSRWPRRAVLTLALLGAVAHLVESALLAADRVPWPGGSRDEVGALLVAGLGVVGAIAMLSAQTWSPAPVVATAAGVISVVLDLGAPHAAARMIPGVLTLLSGAAGAIAATRAQGGGTWQSLQRWLAWGFLAIHALLVLPLLTLGLVAPLPVVLALVALWALALHLALRSYGDRPLSVLLAPIAVAAVTAAVLAFGGEVLGWGP